MEIILRGITYSSLLALCFLFSALAILGIWLAWRAEFSHVQTNPGKVVSAEVKAAMQEMGPSYDYRLLPNGTLQVDKGDGKWLNLKYERR